MKDSINRKAQQAAMVETSDDRNGVVVNSPMGCRRGTCDRLNKRHSELSGRGEVHQCEKKSSSEISAKNEHCSGSTVLPYVQCASRPKIRICTKLYRTSNVPEQKIATTGTH